MKIKFYLRRPAPGEKASAETKAAFNPNASTAIFALINYNGNTVKIYTNESIVPKYWNGDTQGARNTPKFPEHPEFNERLNQIRSTINRTYLDYRNNNTHTVPAPAVLKPLIESALKRGTQKITFLAYFEDFVKRSEAGKRIDPRSKKPVRPGVAKGYRTTYNHLISFSKKKKFDFETIDLGFHKEFTDYLSASPLSLNASTIGSNIQRIKAVMAEATEKGANSNMTFKSRYFIKQSEEAETIYLNAQELKEMQDLDLSNNQRLDNVRDLFLIGCYTGLRFSDFSILKPKSIVEGFIRVTQTKTGDPVIIPVHEVVRKIMMKYNGDSPRTISNEKLNAYLKELGQLMPCLKKMESKTFTKGGAKITRTYKKWELLTTHTARRSFATNEYLAGTPSITIMAITGHRTEKSFLKYIRVTKDEHAQKIKELWAARENNLKAV